MTINYKILLPYLQPEKLINLVDQKKLCSIILNKILFTGR